MVKQGKKLYFWGKVQFGVLVSFPGVKITAAFLCTKYFSFYSHSQKEEIFSSFWDISNFSKFASFCLTSEKIDIIFMDFSDINHKNNLSSNETLQNFLLSNEKGKILITIRIPLMKGKFLHSLISLSQASVGVNIEPVQDSINLFQQSLWVLLWPSNLLKRGSQNFWSQSRVMFIWAERVSIAWLVPEHEACFQFFSFDKISWEQGQENLLYK